MSFALSRTHLRDAEATISRATSQLRKEHERQRVFTHGLVEFAETGGSLFAWGLVNGRFGVIAPLGVSLDLMVGMVLALGGLFEVGGAKFSPHLLNVAAGSLGSFLFRKGIQVGTNWRTNAGGTALSASDLATGIFGGEFAAKMRGHQPFSSAMGGSSLSDAELAAAMAANRPHG